MSTIPITCGHCGLGVAAEIVHTGANTRGQFVSWLQCPSCQEPSVMTSTRAVYPAAAAGRAIRNLPDDVAKAWEEGRIAHNVAAYTAAEMMFRKILMHAAVDKAGATTGESFAHYIDALDAQGFITTGLKPVVDQIRHRGNAANHELPASTEQESLATLTITEHLLEAMYELPGMVSSP